MRRGARPRRPSWPSSTSRCRQHVGPRRVPLPQGGGAASSSPMTSLYAAHASRARSRCRLTPASVGRRTRHGLGGRPSGTTAGTMTTSGRECWARSKSSARPGRGDRREQPGRELPSSAPCTSSATQAPRSSVTAAIEQQRPQPRRAAPPPEHVHAGLRPEVQHLAQRLGAAAVQHRVGRVGAVEHQVDRGAVAARQPLGDLLRRAPRPAALNSSSARPRTSCPTSAVAQPLPRRRRLGDQRGQHEAASPDSARAARPAPAAAAASTRDGVVPARAEHADVAAGHGGQRDGRGARRATSMLWPTRARGGSAGAACPRSELVGRGRAAAVEQPRLGRAPSYQRPGAGAAPRRTAALGAGVGDAHDALPCLHAGLVVDHGVPARQLQRRRRCVSSSTRRARGSAMRSTNCSKIAGRPQNASMPDTSWLASTRWMPCERPRRAMSSSRACAVVGDGVALGEQVLELVDHRDDPRPLALRVVARAGPPAW